MFHTLFIHLRVDGFGLLYHGCCVKTAAVNSPVSVMFSGAEVDMPSCLCCGTVTYSQTFLLGLFSAQ